jgi:hypothetical protein
MLGRKRSLRAPRIECESSKRYDGANLTCSSATLDFKPARAALRPPFHGLVTEDNPFCASPD